MSLLGRLTTLAAFAMCGAAAATFDGRLNVVASQPVLELEAKIPLGDVRGRIDHMDVDRKRSRLFVSELGNNSVGVVDFTARKVIHRISGLSAPQGVGYVPSTETLYVANGGDGSLRLFRGAEYADDGRIAVGRDADNIRLDAPRDEVLVGYGSGALAVIDVRTRRQLVSISLPGHPESFRLQPGTGKVFVNVPDAHAVAVVDRTAAKRVAIWPMSAQANFPMALDDDGRVIVVFRSPPTLRALSAKTGATLATAATCGDADDVFVDAKRRRLYVSCGEGFIDVFDAQPSGFRRLARVATAAGARTSFFVPEWDRLILAARARAGRPAALWVFRPRP